MRIFVDRWTTKNYTEQSARWAILSPKKSPFLEERKDKGEDTTQGKYDIGKYGEATYG